MEEINSEAQIKEEEEKVESPTSKVIRENIREKSFWERSVERLGKCKARVHKNVPRRRDMENEEPENNAKNRLILKIRKQKSGKSSI